MQVPRPRNSNLLRLLPDLRNASPTRGHRMRLLPNLRNKRLSPSGRPANTSDLRDQCPCPRSSKRAKTHDTAETASVGEAHPYAFVDGENIEDPDKEGDPTC